STLATLYAYPLRGKPTPAFHPFTATGGTATPSAGCAGFCVTPLAQHAAHHVHHRVEFGHGLVDGCPLLLQADPLLLRLVERQLELSRVRAVRIVEVDHLLDLAQRKPDLATKQDKLQPGLV